MSAARAPWAPLTLPRGGERLPPPRPGPRPPRPVSASALGPGTRGPARRPGASLSGRVPGGPGRRPGRGPGAPGRGCGAQASARGTRCAGCAAARAPGSSGPSAAAARAPRPPRAAESRRDGRPVEALKPEVVRRVPPSCPGSRGGRPSPVQFLPSSCGFASRALLRAGLRGKGHPSHTAFRRCHRTPPQRQAAPVDLRPPPSHTRWQHLGLRR